jgi:hydrogenase nickel incorporation protein HypB
MCDSCGCDTATAHHHTHEHDHEHGHTHAHDHKHENHPGHVSDHDHAHAAPATRTVALEQRVLARNDATAAANRAWLEARGVVALNLISSPGSGKTTLLERTLERLSGTLPCAVIAGDQQTDNDAQRLAGKGAIVRHIETVSACHLDAERVGALLPEVCADGARLLFIENVGNLVCPSAFDLGEHFKVALLSTTEGEDKPVKYPALFAQAPVTVLTKMDLVPHLDWDVKTCRTWLRKVHPGAFVFELSARTGEGMDAWIDYLVSLSL